MEERERLEQVNAAGLSPTARTLNVLIKGFVACDSLTAALEVFNSFCAAGGSPGLLAYNILIDGFARNGQLLNAESLASQLRAQGLEEDSYTFNALIRAAAAANRPQRSLAYRRLMVSRGVSADAVTLTLLADAHTRLGRPLHALEGARAAVEAASGERGEPTPLLDRPLAVRLLSACQAGSKIDDEHAKAARTHALWVLESFADAQAARRREEERTRRRGRGDHLPPQHAACSPLASELFNEPYAMRDLIRTFANAGDYEGARQFFERASRPRPFVVWSEMLKVCNACGDTALASEILLEMGADKDQLQDVEHEDQDQDES